MTDITSFWLIVVLASVSSYVVLTKESTNALLMACMGFALWVIAAFSAFGVEHISDGVVTTYSYPALGALFFLAAVVMLIGILELSFNIEIISGRL